MHFLSHFNHCDLCQLLVLVLLIGLVAYLNKVTRIDENRFWTYHDPKFNAGGGKAATLNSLNSK